MNVGSSSNAVGAFFAVFLGVYVSAMIGLPVVLGLEGYPKPFIARVLVIVSAVSVMVLVVAAVLLHR